MYGACMAMGSTCCSCKRRPPKKKSKKKKKPEKFSYTKMAAAIKKYGKMAKPRRPRRKSGPILPRHLRGVIRSTALNGVSSLPTPQHHPVPGFDGKFYPNNAAAQAAMVDEDDEPMSALAASFSGGGASGGGGNAPGFNADAQVAMRTEAFKRARLERPSEEEINAHLINQELDMRLNDDLNSGLTVVSRVP